MSKKFNLRDRVVDGEIDLSSIDLHEVPVRDIAVFKTAVSLNLSDNRIITLGKNISLLNHLVKLDLSKNQLKSLPDNFGDLVLLEYLNLFSNKLNHLPLSFGNLRNLNWLNLSNNPLVPALSEIAGSCQDSQQCQLCAKKVVKVIGDAQERLLEEQRKILELEKEKEMAEKAAAKKDNQKNKKANKGDNKKKSQENGLKNWNEQNTNEQVSNNQKKKDNQKDKSNKGNGKTSKKQSRGFFRSFFRFLFLFFTFYTTLSGFLYLVDVDKYIQLRNGVLHMWNQTFELLPTEVVERGRQAEGYVRPAIEVSVVKVITFANETSTFLNNDPRVRDYWNNVKELTSGVCYRAVDFFRTVYHQIPVYYHDAKNRLFQ